MRRTAALIATVGLVAALSACASPSTSAADCDAPYTSGPSSDAVTAEGDFATLPAVTVPSPLNASKTEVSTLIEGSGSGLVEGQLIDADYTLVNGATGETITSTNYDGVTAGQIVAGGQSITGLADGVLCATVGSRIAIAIAPEDGLGDANAASFGLTGADTLVVVVDIERAYPTKADGDDQIAKNDFPTVTLAPSGQPGLSTPQGEAPTDLKITDLKTGDGETVQEGDQVVVNYTGWLWSDGTVFDSSWENGSPITLLAADGSTTQGGVVPGFAEAIIGAKVGSQVLAVIPPELGYGDTANSAIPAGSTLVFVVDILGIR